MQDTQHRLLVKPEPYERQLVDLRARRKTELALAGRLDLDPPISDVGEQRGTASTVTPLPNLRPRQFRLLEEAGE